MSTRQNHFETRKPLLYIIQPESNEVLVNMQRIYISKVAEADRKKIDEEKSVSNDLETEMDVEKVNEQQDSYSIENIEVDGEIQKINIEQTINEISASKMVVEEPKKVITGYRRKAFKEMDIAEKVNFLINKPGYLPNAIVQISTDTSNFTGVVLSFGDGKVLLDQLLMGNKPILINLKDVTDIKLITY